MDCAEFRELLGAEVDGERAAGGDAAAAHLHQCATCRELAAAAKTLRGDLERERALAPGGMASAADSQGATAQRRFELLLRAWQSGRAENSPRLLPRPRRLRTAAAALLFVFAGALGSALTWQFAARPPSASPPAPPQAYDGPRFLLALLERQPFGAARPPADVEQRVVGEYVAWAQRLEKDGRLEAADRLRDDPRARLRVSGGRIVVEEPPPDEGEFHLGGFFLIKAPSMDEAILLTRSCPHLRYGGEIELREVDPGK